MAANGGEQKANGGIPSVLSARYQRYHAHRSIG
jgi:hypothetical protein